MPSYMLPRLVFRGQFLAAPSTTNNWIQTYQNAPKDWSNTNDDPTDSSPLGPNNWNPFGGADVRFPTTRLVDAVTTPGEAWDGKGPTLVIETDFNRSTAKICDQDPMMQMMSRIFGLNFVIKDSESGTIYLKGQMHHCAFTDIAAISLGPQARYTSALKFTQVTEPGPENAALKALYDLAGDETETLGITMMVGAHFHSDQSLPYANIGTGTYIIGPLADGLDGFGNHQEVFQRRLLASPGGVTPSLNTSYMALDGRTLTVDMANALGFTSQEIAAERSKQTAPGTRFQEQPIGEITVAALESDADIVFGPTGIDFDGVTGTTVLSAGDIITEKQFTPLGTLNFQATASDADSLLETTGLVFDFALTADQAKAAASKPLALLKKSGGNCVIASRETLAGINMAYTGGRAIATKGVAVGQDFATTRVSARQYGTVLDPAGYPQQMSVAAVRPQDMSNTGNDSSDFAAAGGRVGLPLAALVPTLVDDTVTFQVVKEIASPRKTSSNGYTDIGGQMYQYNVEPNISSAITSFPPTQKEITTLETTEQGQMDFISVLALDTGTATAEPDFATDIKPIMQQFSNLYPVMSRYLFDLADEAQLQKNATILYFAFNASQTSGHYMPVTRDMPQWQRATICNWLKQFMTPEQIGQMDARSVAEVLPALGAAPDDEGTAGVLAGLAAHLRTTATEAADLLLDLGVPVDADLGEIMGAQGDKIMPMLLRTLQRTKRQTRGAPEATADPKPSAPTAPRRPNLARALKARYRHLDADTAKEFSKVGVMYQMMHDGT